VGKLTLLLYSKLYFFFLAEDAGKEEFFSNKLDIVLKFRILLIVR